MFNTMLATLENITKISDSFRIMKDRLESRFASASDRASIQPLFAEPEQAIAATKKSVESDLALLHQGVKSLEGLTNPPFEGDFAAQELDVKSGKDSIQQLALVNFNAGAYAENGRMIGAFRNAVSKIVKNFFSPELAA